jgi:AraC-like DNA-binding protein
MNVSVLMVRALLHCCAPRGVDRDMLLGQTKLQHTDLADLRLRISGEDFGALAVRAVELTGDPGFGLVLGSEMPEHALQIVGYMLRSAPSLRDAHRAFTRYASLLAALPCWGLEEDGEQAAITFACTLSSELSQRMAHEWAMALCCRYVGDFSQSPALKPLAVELPYPAPPYASRYGEVFDCETRFSRRRAAVIFPRALLDLPQLHGDHAAFAALTAMADGLLREAVSEGGTVQAVRTLLRRSKDLAQLDVDSIARQLGVSQSTLRRALAADGISPYALVEEARCEQACRALRESRAPLKGIAIELGFADASSFNRAFRRWKGVTPAAYRACLAPQAIL